MKQKLVVFILFAICNLSFAQQWKRIVLRDKWGDVSGNSYAQTQVGECKNGGISEMIHLGFGVADEQKNLLTIASSADIFHPCHTFVRESIKFSIRQNGKTFTFNGINEPTNNIQTMGILVISDKLIELLHGIGTWDVLIESDSWYIRTKIYGELPK